jgi:hypothetical protein
VPNSRLGNPARIRISKGKAGGEVLTRVSSLEILPTYLYSRYEGRASMDFRVLDFLKLSGELRAGANRFGLGRARRKELRRLEALMDKVLGAASRAIESIPRPVPQS